MLKKLLFVCLFFSPSFAFSQTVRALKMGDDVALSSSAILNAPTSIESKTLNVTSATVQNNFFFTDSDSRTRIRMFDTNLPLSGGFGPQVVRPYLWHDSFESSGFAGCFNIGSSTESITPTTELSLSLGWSVMTICPPSTSTGGSVSIETKPTGLNGDEGIFSVTSDQISFSVNGVQVAVWDSSSFRTSNIVANSVIGSNTGLFNYAGTTVTYSAPPVDTLNRVPILYNGTISFPLMANGASLDTYNLFTGSDVFSGGLNIASATATSPTLTNTGDFSIDTSSGQVLISTNGSSGIASLQYWIPNSIVIATPTVGDYHFFDKAWFEVGIDTVVCVSSASTSTTIQLYECDKNGSNCSSMGSATACTTTETVLSLTDTDIASEDRIRVMVTATSGTPGEVAIDMKAHEVRH